jgi:hypothetical protein
VTPDERANRAERVIDETCEQLVELASYFSSEESRATAATVHALELAAGLLARNARIAGIVLDPPRNGGTGGSSSSNS